MSHLDRRQVLRLFGAAAAASTTAGIAGCTSAPPGTAAEEPSGLTVTVGLMAPTTGPYARIGADIVRGFQLYVDDHDGLLGRHRVNVQTVEEGDNAKAAAGAVEGLLDQQVLAIAGVASPVALGAIASAVEEAKVPLVTAGISPAALTSTFYIWRVSQVEGEAGLSLANYAYARGLRTYVLRDSSTTGAEEASQFAQGFRNHEPAGTIAGVSVGLGDYTERLEAAAATGADTIFAAFTGEEAAKLLSAYAVAGLDARLLGPGSLTETVDLARLRRLPEGVYTAMYYAPDIDNEINRRFVASYHKRHGQQPSTSAMAAYDCASTMDKALRLVEGNPTPVALNRAYSELGQIESPRGFWAFNINRSPQQKWYLRHLRRDGQVPGNLLDTDLAVLS